MVMGTYDDLESCVGFEWDAGNEGKNWDKHGVSDGEALSFLVLDATASTYWALDDEDRYIAAFRGRIGSILGASRATIPARSAP